jgi:hypothetical protein
VKVSSVRTTIVLPAVSDPGIARGVAWVAFAQPGSAVGELIDSGRDVTDVRVESL